MQLNLLSGHHSQIIPDHLIPKVRRKNERKLSFHVYTELVKPQFSIIRDPVGDRYVTFRGSWAHIQLPFDYFDLSFGGSKVLDIDYVTERLNDKVIPFIQHVRSALIIRDETYFSPICFWNYVMLSAINGEVVQMSKIQRCFDLGVHDDELSPLFLDEGSSFQIYNLGTHAGVVLPPSVSRYYDRAIYLAYIRDFRVFNSFGKKVIWLKDRKINMNGLRELLGGLKNNLIGFHVEQTLNRLHVFKYDKSDDLIDAMYFEIYRYWKDFVDIFNGAGFSFKRTSYCIGSTNSDLHLKLLGILSTSTPPIDLPIARVGTLSTFKNFVDRGAYVALKSMIGDVNLPDMLKPFYPIYTLDDLADNNYVPVFWKGVKLMYNSFDPTEPSYSNYELVSLPNPKIPMTDNYLVDALDLVKLHVNREFICTPKNVFQIRTFNCSSTERSYQDLYSGTVQNYRQYWYDFRLQTKDLRKDGRVVDHRNFFKVHNSKWSVDEFNVTQFLYNVLEPQRKLEVEDRVKWNRSTLKLLSVVNQLAIKGVFDVTDRPINLLICGVIEEPLVSLLKRSTVGRNLKIRAFGDESRWPFDRSKIENLVFGKPMDIIISDIDQSYGVDEEQIVNIIGNNLRWFLRLSPKVIVLKCQYTFGRVLLKLMRNIGGLKFTKAEVWKVYNSGPLGVESYLYFEIGTETNEYFVPKGQIETYLRDLDYLGFKPTSFVRNPKLISMANTLSFRFEYAGFDYYVNKIFDNATYKPCVSGLLNLCDVVRVRPHGQSARPGILCYGSTSAKRSILCFRSQNLSMLEDAKYDRMPTNFSFDSVQNEVFLNNGTFLPADRLYNLVMKFVIKYRILSSQYIDGIRTNLFDIGGRELEGIVYCPSHFKYILVDKVNLPSFISFFHIDHLNMHVDWDEVPNEFDHGGVVTLMFVLMNGVLLKASILERIAFLNKLLNKGLKIIFNCYMIPTARSDDEESVEISAEKTGVIRLGQTESGEAGGSFGEYDLVPLIEKSDLDVLAGINKYVITYRDVVDACYYFGISLNPSLLHNLDLFNEFCPLYFSQ